MADKKSKFKIEPDINITKSSSNPNPKVKVKKEYPILSKLMPKGSDKKDKESAKRMSDYVQTEMAKKRTATEGSFAKGGLVRSGKPKIAKKGWR